MQRRRLEAHESAQNSAGFGSCARFIRRIQVKNNTDENILQEVNMIPGAIKENIYSRVCICIFIFSLFFAGHNIL